MKKKFITTIVIETSYDPESMGNVQLVMDLSSGNAELKSRKTDEVDTYAEIETKHSLALDSKVVPSQKKK